MTTQNAKNFQKATDQNDGWFDEIVSTLRLDQQLLKNDLLDPEMKKFYNDMFSGDMEAFSVQMRDASTRFFVSRLIKEYISHFASFKKNPKKLGLELSNSKILVWAEVYDNDMETEKALILAQAKINAEYSKFGFAVSSTIVEECDNLTVPSHYHPVAIPSA